MIRTSSVQYCITHSYINKYHNTDAACAMIFVVNCRDFILNKSSFDFHTFFFYSEKYGHLCITTLFHLSWMNLGDAMRA